MGTDLSTSLYYLEVPVTIGYNYQLGTGILHGGLGPYAAAGLLGFYNSSGKTTAVEFGKNKDLTRMDYGLTLRAGYLLNKKWDLTLNYDWGLRNLTPGSDDKAHNRALSLNLGYRFK